MKLIIKINFVSFISQETTDGILTDKNVSSGFSNLGKSADGNQLVYLHFSLPVSILLMAVTKLQNIP